MLGDLCARILRSFHSTVCAAKVAIGAQVFDSRVVFPSVPRDESEPTFRPGNALWDGAWDSLEGGDNAYGRVGALSLWVTIRDAEGQEFYFSTGGIEVTAKLRGFLTQEFVEVAVKDLLRDTDRNGDAVTLALEALGGERYDERRAKRSTRGASSSAS